MATLTKSQKKVFTVAAVLIVVFMLFVIFMYLPYVQSVKRSKAQLVTLEGLISKIEQLGGKNIPLHVGIEAFQQKLQELDSKFPDKEEESLTNISRFARESNIEIASLKPQPKSVVLDESRQEVQLGGKVFRKVAVMLQLKCSYKNLVQFIEKLEQGLPALVSIERIDITKSSSGDTPLEVSLDLIVYLLS
ncbi:type 4a pilus biogenesis protein PilO [Candidatus Omnitrophota bacterium]